MTVALVERARQGDDAAFTELVDMHGDRCYAIAYRILRDTERAQDAVQSAFLLCWRELPKLRDPERFWGTWVVPAITRDHPSYPEQEYWRGRIWPPHNYLLHVGLRRYGFDGVAAELAARSVALLLQEWERCGHAHENYHGGTGEGCDVATSDPYYLWSGLLALPSLEPAWVLR